MIARGLSAALAGLFLAASAFAQAPAAQTPAALPRTADGHPDLQGIWTTRFLTPLERAPGVASLSLGADEAAALARQMLAKRASPGELDPLIAEPDAHELARVRGEWRTSLVTAPADGQLPWTEEGKELLAAQRASLTGLDGPEQRSAVERCILGSGSAPFTIANAGMYRQIVQTPGAVAIFTESQSDLRIIGIGAAHRPAALVSPSGDSVGRWEGSTLVVETTGAEPALPTRNGALGMLLIVRPQAKVIERLTPVSRDELLYQYTIEDPGIYRPWSAEFSLMRSSERIYEWGCHENNTSLANMLEGARMTERSAAPSGAQVAPARKAASRTRTTRKQ